MAESNVKMCTDQSIDFELSGTCEDEIELEFAEENKSLYICRHVIVRCSPVFKAIFENELIEKREGKVKIMDHSFDDFKEFLLCIDPSSLKDIDESNVLKIASIADKYMHSTLITRCKRVMVQWLKSCKTAAAEVKNSTSHTQMRNVQCPSIVISCLRVLAKAAELNYTGIINKATDAIACFSSTIYLRKVWIYFNGNRCVFGNITHMVNETERESQKECCAVFATLPDTIKYEITSKRLSLAENNELLI